MGAKIVLADDLSFMRMVQKEILEEKGYTIGPTKVYLKNGLAKVEIALAKGKKNYDKRDATAKRDAKREIDRTMKERNR